MNLYNYLKETERINSLKLRLKDLLFKVQDLAAEYIFEAEESEYGSILDNIHELLTQVTEVFNSIGFDYQPETVPDEKEEVFKSILEKYRQQISYFFNNFNEDIFEAFNTQTRYMLNLIEVHRTNFLEEGEVLIDEAEQDN